MIKLDGRLAMVFFSMSVKAYPRNFETLAFGDCSGETLLVRLWMSIRAVITIYRIKLRVSIMFAPLFDGKSRSGTGLFPEQV